MHFQLLRSSAQRLSEVPQGNRRSQMHPKRWMIVILIYSIFRIYINIKNKQSGKHTLILFQYLFHIIQNLRVEGLYFDYFQVA